MIFELVTEANSVDLLMIEQVEVPELEADDNILMLDAGIQLKTGTTILSIVTDKGRLIAHTLSVEGNCSIHLDEQLVRGRVTGSCSTKDSICLSIEPASRSSTENLMFLKLRQEYQ